MPNQIQPPQNPNVLAFLQELFQRLYTKSPLFFRIIQWVTGIALLITGIPAFLGMLNVHLPALWSDKLNQVIAYISAGMYFVSLLTTQSKSVGITDAGQVVKKTNEQLLPFTAAAEQKAAEKKVVEKVDVINTATGETAKAIVVPTPVDDKSSNKPNVGE